MQAVAGLRVQSRAVLSVHRIWHRTGWLAPAGRCRTQTGFQLLVHAPGAAAVCLRGGGARGGTRSVSQPALLAAPGSRDSRRGLLDLREHRGVASEGWRTDND